ncbi:MAG TPA: hypothetical protein ENJ77_01700, partial [Candidatus Moranbacteria bacterium]|nr:hypothetical protein [Candidatus Moranbacteria bacterium]
FFFFVQEWIGPFFFIYLGSQLVVDWAAAWVITFSALLAAAIIALFQFVTAAAAGRRTAGLDRADAVLLGFGMWPRDVLAFVVLGIAATGGLVATDDRFVTVVVITVLLLNIAASLALRFYKPYYHKLKKI